MKMFKEANYKINDIRHIQNPNNFDTDVDIVLTIHLTHDELEDFRNQSHIEGGELGILILDLMTHSEKFNYPRKW